MVVKFMKERHLTSFQIIIIGFALVILAGALLGLFSALAACWLLRGGART